ncbi:ATP-binding protein [Mangrovimicrobium sediminis]|uniref:histidine kinase n=1 Tax=Mangrovimicrobium sediminis TaxID=2562682 RepID=A0A4Z0M205_9GAMM|nr:ATP-binding protein [Haliea sp. SAOS-164]TGD73559.1 ATP-binding protein [Haliea sp. SAOS-164]
MKRAVIRGIVQWLGLLTFGAVGFGALWYLLEPPWQWILSLAWLVPVAVLAHWAESSPYRRQVRALSSMIAGWRDSDFALSIRSSNVPELQALTEELNSVGELLRRERHHLVQRELLLQTVIQASPMAVLLCDQSGRVVLSNVMANQWFGHGGRLAGHALEQIADQLPESLREALQQEGETLCSFGPEAAPESYHVSRTRFDLNGQIHHLVLVREMTRELSRREAAVWKKVIRVMSHEINNSLAPISSLAHSGRQFAEQGDTQPLARVFDTIENRARHLDDFIAGYARFAKLSAPAIQRVEVEPFLASLCAPLDCRYALENPASHGSFDPAQIEQVLINLVKNALEAGSSAGEVSVHWVEEGGCPALQVRDRGQGMTAESMEKALLPFYSTKRSGTGLGLALAREILEAHDGSIALTPREGGGTQVSLRFPAVAAGQA